jgi:hypothetical protein
LIALRLHAGLLLCKRTDGLGRVYILRRGRQAGSSHAAFAPLVSSVRDRRT